MAKEKVKPLIMADGNIARCGMIVAFKLDADIRRKVCKITKLRTRLEAGGTCITTDADSFTDPNWTCCDCNLRRATEQEKKLYKKLKKRSKSISQCKRKKA
jgi:hypothetical protein